MSVPSAKRRGWLTCTCCALVCRLALGDPATTPSPSPATDVREPIAQMERSRVVFLVPNAMEEPFERQLREALAAQLSDQPLVVEVIHESLSGDSLDVQYDRASSQLVAREALAAFWLDAVDTSSWLLYLIHGPARRVLVRTIEAPSGERAATIEAVALIVAGSVRVLREGGRVGMSEIVVARTGPTPEEPASKRIPTAAAPAAGRPHPKPTISQPIGRLRAALGYHPATFVRESLDRPTSLAKAGLAHGAVVELDAQHHTGAFLGLAYRVHPSITVKSSAGRFRVTRTPIRSQAGYVWAMDPHWTIDGAAVLGVDLLRRERATDAPKDTTTPAQRFTVVSFGLRSLLERHFGRLGIYATASIERVANPTTFQLKRPERDTVLLQQRPVNIELGMGISGAFEIK